jgi:hypothetical protein
MRTGSGTQNSGGLAPLRLAGYLLIGLRDEIEAQFRWHDCGRNSQKRENMARSHGKRPLWKKLTRGELRRTVRILIEDPWFFRIAVVCVLGVAAMALFVLKLWNTAPPWHKGTMRISGLDVVQSWSLRRTAEARAREGKLPEAMAAWRGAIINSPANTEIYRGMLQTLIDAKERRREYIPFGVAEGRMLLELSRTNAADLELIASFFRRFELFDWELAMLRGHSTNLTAGGNKLYAEALFFTGDMPRFSAAWKEHADQFTNDSRLALVRTAWSAEWGPAGGMLPARRELAAACRDPRMGNYAAKLQLQVSYHLPDFPSYKSALDQLIDAHEDRVIDHVRYWRLLQDEGRATEASDLARRYSDSPLTSQDVLQMANVFDALKMTDYAVVFLAKQILVFREDADLWVTRAEMLTRLRRWDDLREMAVAMRFDYYLGQLENAGSIFPKVLESPFPTPSMAVRAAANLRTIGFPKVATELLKTNEAVFSNQKEFWLQLTISAYASGDSVLLERAARRGYELDPTSTQAINDYAAALIANRAQPDEAVTLTLKLIADDPERLGFLINHAMALILNRRLDEAERILDRIQSSTLTSFDSALVHYARFDIWVQRNQPARAKEEAAKIERRYLLPIQARFIDDNLARFESE